MASLCFLMTINRSYIPTSYFSKFILKKTGNIPLNKDLIYRSYINTSKLSIPKSNVKLFSNGRLKKYYNRNSKLIILGHPSIVSLDCSRYFRTSERRYFHPVLWAFLRPALKLLAIITGRSFRNWWRDLPPNRKKYFIGVIKENRKKIAFFALTSIILSLIYYVSHIEETPITKRRRFMAFNPKQLEQINHIEFEKIMTKLKNKVLPAHHPQTLKVKAVVERIIAANQDVEGMKDKQWGVAVINSSIENAFVLPIGYVFVFTGMLSLCRNDDELGTVLAHEMAHCLQNHGAENISHTHLLDLISIIIIGAIWAIIPSDSISVLTHWLYKQVQNIFFGLPYNRKIETEADYVGLQLAAKACFDVRESSAFWAKMAIIHENINQVPAIEFLSTHPSHEKRSEYLDSIMDEALMLRHSCGCPKLKTVDPRLNTEVFAKVLEATRKKYLEQYPKPVVPFHI